MHKYFNIGFLLFSQLTILGGLNDFSWAAKLSDYSPYEYDVRFTNPICAEYTYDEPVTSNSGRELPAKPKNAFCKSRDGRNNFNRAGTPSEKLLEWISASATKEIFLTFLSFSERRIAAALCEAIKERDVKVTIVLDQETETAAVDGIVANCPSKTAKNRPRLELRGHVTGMGYAHNKIIIVNPNSETEIRIAFGSGNMTSGIVLHHENWHFVSTNPESYFAQAHLCVMNGELEHAESAATFRAHMQSCLGDIEAAPESDIQSFFVPGQGPEALQAIQAELEKSEQVDLAAHRFSYGTLIQSLIDKLENVSSFSLRLLFDDDMFWVGERGATNRPNMRQEYTHVRKLVRAGADVRYMETNHAERLLHHNKFIVFHDRQGPFATFAGAGNFTGDAFARNLENFYMIKIPAVVEKMAEQYEHLFESLATAPDDLPAEDILP